jgi:hypothetical protein
VFPKFFPEASFKFTKTPRIKILMNALRNFIAENENIHVKLHFASKISN